MDIEEVARDNPESIVTEPIDILQGIKPEQCNKVAAAMGFEGAQLEQVL